MRTPKKSPPVSDDELRQEYEKSTWHRAGIPMERALERVSWLRGVLEGGAARNNRSSIRSPRSSAAQKKRPPEST